eukprot:TRINITY_DN29802_c0_g1_i1.p1 TRINITY_DN29802_c0_g1~~TRINITY_DN29802_c0_g1_i1.p1  ORF type:complete len:269 (+),score=44.21 TRINITY_DN29802_c0_g1_i1:110-916(+)
MGCSGSSSASASAASSPSVRSGPTASTSATSTATLQQRAVNAPVASPATMAFSTSTSSFVFPMERSDLDDADEYGPNSLVSTFDVLQALFAGVEPHVLERVLAVQGISVRGAARNGPPGSTSASPGSPPASPAALRALPHIKVSQHDIKVSESSECTVCFESMELGQPGVRIPCGHLYHEDCITQWLSKSNECPVCRYELPTDDKEYEIGRKQRMANRKIRVRREDLAMKSPKELQRLAEHLAVDTKGCLEKHEIVDCIAASSRVSII